MADYIDAGALRQMLTRKIRTQRSTIEINKLLSALDEFAVPERVTVEYPGWISVNERLPGMGQYVLLLHTYHSRGDYAEYEATTIGYYFKPEKGMPYFYYVGVSNYGDMVRASSMCPGDECVTHWMPLPEPPTDEQEATNATR